MMTTFTLLFFAIFTLLPIISSQNFAYNKARGRYKVSKQSALATNDSDGALRLFASATEPELHTYVAPFSPKHWPNHRPNVFRLINDNNVDLFISWGASADKVINNDSILSRSQSVRIRKFTSTWKAGDILACQHESCLSMLFSLFRRRLLKNLDRQVIDAFNGHHMSYFLSELGKTLTSKNQRTVYSTLDELSETLLEKYAPLITKSLSDDLQYLSSKVLKIFLLNSQACKIISKASLQIFLQKSVTGKLLSPECLASHDLSGIKVSKLELTKGALSKYNGALSPEFSAALNNFTTSELASNLNKAERPGRKIDFTKLTSRALGGLRQALLIGRLYSVDGTIPIPIVGEKLKNVPKGILSGLSSEDATLTLSRLHEDDKRNLTLSMTIEIIKNYPQRCDILLPEHISKETEITKETCFLAMDPLVQAKAVAIAKILPSDAFHRLTASKVEDWTFSKRDGEKTWEGLKVLTILPNRSNMKDLVKGLGLDPDGDNPCKTLQRLDDITENQPLLSFITPDCFQASGIELPQDEVGLRKIPDRLKLLVSYSDLLFTKPKSFFSDMTVETFDYLVGSGRFCQFVDEETFMLIPSKVLIKVDTTCLVALSFRAKLKAVQVIAISAQTWAHTPASLIPPELFVHMAEEQLSLAASRAPNPLDRNIGTFLTSKVIENMQPLQISVLSSKHWDSCPEEAFSGLNIPEKLIIIPPQAMSTWRLSQVLKIPDGIISVLSVIQAEQIGASTPNPDTLIINLLERPVSEEVSVTLKKRLSPTSLIPNNDGWSWWRWMVVLWVVLILLMVPFVYYSVRKRQTLNF